MKSSTSEMGFSRSLSTCVLSTLAKKQRWKFQNLVKLSTICFVKNNKKNLWNFTLLNTYAVICHRVYIVKSIFHFFLIIEVCLSSFFGKCYCMGMMVLSKRNVLPCIYKLISVSSSWIDLEVSWEKHWIGWVEKSKIYAFVDSKKH